LIRDRDSNYGGPFDEVFRAGVFMIRMPSLRHRRQTRSPSASSGPCAECVDWLLIRNRRQLECVLRVYIDHYNRERPHRSYEPRPPKPDEPPDRSVVGEIRRRDRLGGLIHEYYRAAA
jgi:hypothetical protein